MSSDLNVASRRFPRPQRRAPHREHFIDHPGYEVGDPAAFAGGKNTRDKLKLWCRLCLDRRVQDAMADDALDVIHGRRCAARDHDTILRDCESHADCRQYDSSYISSMGPRSPCSGLDREPYRELSGPSTRLFAAI